MGSASCAVHRQPLLDLLQRYREAFPAEGFVVGRFRDFVTAHEDCLLRSCVPGHITASAWILSSDHRRFLLTHHRKLGRWLQLGGHVDGEPEVHRAALREAREESGIGGFELVGLQGEVVPLDLDVHRIPAIGEEPEHLHYDVRFLLVSEPGRLAKNSAESLELRWFESGDLESVPYEESLYRLGRKAASRLAID